MGPSSLRRTLPLLAALLVTACSCDEAPPEPVNRNGISEGHLPPELPPPPAPTSTESAAPAAAPSPKPPLELEWTAPAGWRFLGAPSLGATRAHFYALEEQGRKPPEHVDVYVVHLVNTRGTTPEERLTDAVAQETLAFSRVESKDVTTQVVGDRTVTVVEVTGSRREVGEDDKPVERAGRAQLSALLPGDAHPVRVGMHGRKDLVARSRSAFFEFVASLRVKPH